MANTKKSPAPLTVAAHARLDQMMPAMLRRLIQSIPTVNNAALSRAGDGALRDAAHSYLRTGKLTETVVLEWDMEP
jgi:hypothetical protein